MSRQNRFNDLTFNGSQPQFHFGIVLLGRTRRVERDTRVRIARLHEIIIVQKLFNVFTTDIGQHFAVDLDAGRKRLAAFRFHLPPKSRILDDVLLGVLEIVFCEHGTYAGAPAARGL
jgi:hypothetical protein